MKKGLQKVLVLLLTLSMLMSMMAVPGFAADELDPADQTIAAETAEDTAGIDAVKEMISKLPNSSDVTEADREAIVAAEAAYEALSAEEQAQLDNETCPSDGQPYGRVLESAQWGLWSLEEVDNTTTLAPGTYDASTVPALSSSYSKGKSTSSRQKPWSVKSITVDENHKVTAIVTVQSSSYSGIIYQGKTYNKTNTSGNCEFEPIPIDLNSTFYFSGVSTSMPRPIAFSVTTEIDEPADYSAVDAALEKVPADLEIYTEKSAAAVRDAVDAVERNLPIDEQERVNEMAAAIETAVDALKEEPTPVEYSGDEVNFINKDGSQFGMFTAQNGTTAKVEGNSVVIHYVPKNTTTYAGFNWGSIDMLAYDDASVKPATEVTFNEDGTIDLTLDKDYCGYSHPIAVVKFKYGGKSAKSWTSGDQYYLAIPSIDHFTAADYSKVNAAIAKVPKDMSKYTDASVKAVNDAVKAVVRGKMANEQAAVDNMAKAINDAVAGLKAKEVNKEVKKGWQKENGGWYFYNNNGTAAKNTWKKDSKGWCYLGSDGKMVANGWAKDSKGTVWMNGSGYWDNGTKWIKSGGNWYHITKGYMDASKWMKDSKGWCYLGKDGKMVTNGWAKDSHGWCWMGSNGYWTSNKWVKDKGEWYYIKSNHYMASNEWAKDSKGWMFMAKNGKITKSKWVKSGGDWYYLKDNGYMATGTLKIGSKTYTFASSGRWVK